MMPPTLPSFMVAAPGQAPKLGADQTAAAGMPGMPLVPTIDPMAWASMASGQQLDGLVLPQVPQLGTAGQDGAPTADGAVQVPLVPQMPQMPLMPMAGMPLTAGQLPLFMPLPLAGMAAGAAGIMNPQLWTMMDPAAAAAMAAAAGLPMGIPSVAAAAAAAGAEATAAAAHAAKAAAPPSENGSRRRPQRKAASMAAAAWASSSEGEQTEDEDGVTRIKRARRGPPDTSGGPSLQQQQRRLQQQQQAEVLEVAGVAARMVACVAAACGEPVLPDTLGMSPADLASTSPQMLRYHQAQRLHQAQQQQAALAAAAAAGQLPVMAPAGGAAGAAPFSYAQLLMQDLPDEELDPEAALLSGPPRVSRFGRVQKPSTQRGPLLSAASPLDGPRAVGGRGGRPQRSAATMFSSDQLAAAFDGGAGPTFADDPDAPQADKICVECGTRTTPLWRTINGLTYCNADGLRMKRKLGML